jgi:hypothetical protein
LLVGAITIVASAVGAVGATLSSLAIVYASKVVPVTPVGVRNFPPTLDNGLTVAALALPAVRAVTAAAAIRIFFIDIWLIPLEVL